MTALNRTIILNADASDTERFATRPHASWPASDTRGKAVSLTIDTETGDLIDYTGPDDVSADELDALQDFPGR